MRNEAERKGKELEQKIAELTGDVGNAGVLVTQATQRLSKVMTDARRQGLAGAFTTRGSKVFRERVGWATVFVGSVVALTILSSIFARDVNSFTFEVLTVALLRRLALAAPLVWLGWYSAMQLGRLGRIQEDYEYKAATALAFQSYRSEVEAVGVDDLTQELLRKAIGTFGDNPVRLYASAEREAVTPAQRALQKLTKEEKQSLLAVALSVLQPSSRP